MTTTIADIVWSWPTAKKDGTIGSGDLSYRIIPFFNYISKDYNNKIQDIADNGFYGRKELRLPSPYTESGAISDLQKNHSHWKNLTVLPIGWNANEENPVSPSVRKAFIDNMTPIRSANYSIYFSNIILSSPNAVAESNASVKKDTAFEDYGGRYPQHVRITLSGNSMRPNTGGFLRPMISNNLMTLFVTHLTQLSTTNTNGGIEYTTLNNYPNVRYHPTMLMNNSLSCIAPDDEDEFGQFEKTQEIDNIINDLLENHEGYRFGAGYQNVPFQQETLFYQIEKYRVGATGNGPVQTFYCSMLSDDGTSIEFVDTQVLPGVEYEYKCYTWDLNNSSKPYRFNETEPKFYIAKSPDPIFVQKIKIEQPPLPKPEISFSNIKHSKNEIMIHLGLSANSENGGFYEMNPAERSALEDREALYDLHGTKDRFVYETQTAIFELYRLKEHPRRHIGDIYNDYHDIASTAEKIKTIEGDFGSSTATFVDKLPYNSDGSSKKYYYVFRCINEYGYPSNPTPIWEVELRRDADETFLYTNVVDFFNSNKNKYKISKSMMKLMQVVPSSNQTIMTTEMLANAAENDSEEINMLNPAAVMGLVEQAMAEQFKNNGLPNLGIAEESIWSEKELDGSFKDGGKRFKIRLSSNDTGRKIDFNLRFVIKKNYTQ